MRRRGTMEERKSMVGKRVGWEGEGKSWMEKRVRKEHPVPSKHGMGGEREGEEGQGRARRVTEDAERRTGQVGGRKDQD